MSNETELQIRRKGLKKKLEARIRRENLRATQTHWAAIVLMIASLSCGVIAGIGGLTKGMSSEILGVLALIPASIAIAVSQFKPQARSSWHYRKSNALSALLDRLDEQLPIVFDAEDIKAISVAHKELRDQMQEEWDKEFQFNWTFHSPPHNRTKGRK
jgi:UPF0716 family protein affecting phage T7 exclusion